MDDQTFQSLKTALAASPYNTTLLLLILRECLARGVEVQGLELLRRADLSGIDGHEDRETIARVFLGAGQAQEALEWTSRDTPTSLMVRARALVSLGRTEEARNAYQGALAMNPTLEDTELDRRIGGTIRDIALERGPRLRVISNDDTGQDEVARLLEPELERVGFADVGGLAEIKEQIRRKIILPFQKPGLFQRFKKRAGGGILMYGPPGCGKTLLARATAGECQARFFNVAISDVLDMYIGESERKLHAIFEKARQSAPAVLFFDEIEAIGGKRQYAREGASAKVVSQFLSEMDGFAQDNKGVLILGATNVPWAVDPAFRRPGRFDRVLFVAPPDRQARESILSLLLAERPVTLDIDLGWLARETSGYSGADLRNIVETSIEEAIEHSLATSQEVPVNMAHLKQALAQVKPTTLEWLTTARNYARYANEGGHYDDVLNFLDRHGKS